MSRPSCPKRAARNRRIVKRFLEGENRLTLSRCYGVSPRMISRIVAHARPAMSLEERDQAFRPGGNCGRPREIVLPPEQMAHYVKVRRHLGAATARRELGLPTR